MVIIGSSFPCAELPPTEVAHSVRIDIDSRVLWNRYPMQVNLFGEDAGDYASASLKGEPDAWDMLGHTVRGLMTRFEATSGR